MAPGVSGPELDELEVRATLPGGEQAPPAHSLRALLRSFGYAAEGVWLLVRTQRNAKIHLALAALALALAALLRISRVEWLVLLLTIALVVGAEGLNTAIEAVVDLASPDYHPLAKRAKDVAAGAVLVIAVCAVFVGALIFLPYLFALLS
jgi:diacylglycerol kinase